MEITDYKVIELMKFFKIELKSDSEIEKMSTKLKKQYSLRANRWESLIKTHIDFEIFKCHQLFSSLSQMVEKTNTRLQSIRDDPNYHFEDNKYKRSIDKIETEVSEMEKHLTSQKRAFDDIHIPYKVTIDLILKFFFHNFSIVSENESRRRD